MRDFAHIWQAAENIVYVAGSARAFGSTLRGSKPPRVKASSVSERASWTGTNSGSETSLASSGPILRESLP